MPGVKARLKLYDYYDEFWGARTGATLAGAGGHEPPQPGQVRFQERGEGPRPFRFSRARAAPLASRLARKSETVCPRGAMVFSESDRHG